MKDLFEEMVQCVEKNNSEPKLKCAFAHKGSEGTLTVCQMINNIIKTKLEIKRKNELKERKKLSLCKKFGRKKLVRPMGTITFDMNFNFNVN